MTRTLGKIVLVLALGVVAVALLPGLASAKNAKYTFNDVTLVDADGTEITGEIEAGVKDVRKATSINCTYFTDDYQDALGYYFEEVGGVPTEAEVLEFCLEEFPNRFS